MYLHLCKIGKRCFIPLKTFLYKIEYLQNRQKTFDLYENVLYHSFSKFPSKKPTENIVYSDRNVYTSVKFGFVLLKKHGKFDKESFHWIEIILCSCSFLKVNVYKVYVQSDSRISVPSKNGLYIISVKVYSRKMVV